MNISIIVPTYNRAHILPMCLDSLVRQSYSKNKYEIIIVDNNSKDNTYYVVKRYIDKYRAISIKYLFEEKQGAGFARNIGAKSAKFEILSFTDDDAILCKDWLKEISNCFKSNPEIVAVTGKIVIKWNKNPPDWVRPYEWLLGTLDYGDEIQCKKGLNMNLGNLSIKKDI